MNANNLRQLDAEVAERVMGFQPCRCSFVHAVISPPPPRCASCGRPLSPPYSSDISAAFQVVERMRELGWEYCSQYGAWTDSKWRWYAAFKSDGEERGAEDELLPLAICRAALQAVGGGER